MNVPSFRVLIARCAFPNLEIERRILGRVGAEVIDGREASDDELTELGRQVDGIITDYFPIRRDQIEKMERCRVICQYGVGLDQIDLAAATERGIVVTHTPDYCTEEVADHALALLLCLWRKVVLLHESVRRGCWDYNVADPIFRIRGRTLGLVGFGRIARNLAAKASAIGFAILVHDPWIDSDVIRSLDVEPCALDLLLARSDVVSLHAPLIPATTHLIGERELGLMKPTAILVNTSRGGLVDQAALVHSLASGRLAAAALDVLEHEPPAPDEPILRAPNVILTPHAGFFSRESLEAVQRQAAEAVATVLSGGVPAVVANPEALTSRRS